MNCQRFSTIRLIAVFVLVNSVVLCNFAFAQQSDPIAELVGLRTQLQTKLDSIVESEGFPGATLAVSFPDGRMISLASGWEDIEAKNRMAPGQVMFTGSVGKTFVSAIALQMVSQGKFGLDDHIQKHVGDDNSESWMKRIPNFDKITIRNLMNHTTGIPRYIFQAEFLETIKGDPYRNWTPKDCLEFVLDLDPIHAPGAGWAYADTNYIILGMLIEKVSGQSFYDLARKNLLEPLNLRHTRPTTQPDLPGLSQGYIGPQNIFGLPEKTVIEPHRYCINPQFEWCGGGFVTNVEDLSNWIRMLHTGKVLADNVYAKLITPVDFRTGKRSESGYGLGTFVWKNDRGTFLGHAGLMPGYLTQVEFSTKYKYSIALQTNTDKTMGQKHHRFVQDVATLVDALFESNDVDSK